MKQPVGRCAERGCECGGGTQVQASVSDDHLTDRRDFLRHAGTMSVGLGLGPAAVFSLQGQAEAAAMAVSAAVQAGKAQHVTILHTSDIHAQLDIHDEFFYENGRPAFKRRGGFATLRTMLAALRKQNPERTLLVDGGDCFQGSAVATLSKGEAIVPLMNVIGYDLVLPGNWEVVYGKDMLMKDMGMYTAARVCANMFHDDGADGGLMFPAYQVFDLGGTKVGFVGYNDPLTPTRQSPAYSTRHPLHTSGRGPRPLREALARGEGLPARVRDVAHGAGAAAEPVQPALG